MGKKYVPSGYQILDLGTLENEDEILNGQSEQRDILLELFRTERIINKPLLLKLSGRMIVIPNFVTMTNIYASFNDSTDGLAYAIRFVYNRVTDKVTVYVHDDL